MTAALFLLATLVAVFGVCTALAVLVDAGLTSGRDLRHAGLILLFAGAGVASRGQDWQWAGWVPVVVAVWLAVRFTLASILLARAQRVRKRRTVRVVDDMELGVIPQEVVDAQLAWDGGTGGIGPLERWEIRRKIAMTAAVDPGAVWPVPGRSRPPRP